MDYRVKYTTHAAQTRNSNMKRAPSKHSTVHKKLYPLASEKKLYEIIMRWHSHFLARFSYKLVIHLSCDFAWANCYIFFPTVNKRENKSDLYQNKSNRK